MLYQRFNRWFNINNNDYKKPINLGGSEEISILKLAQIIKRKSTSKIDIIFKNLPQDDPLKRKPDLFKAKNFKLGSTY